MPAAGNERETRSGLSCGSRLAAFIVPVTLLLMAGLLLFHKIPDGYDRVHCAENWTLTERVTIVLNCDSPEYLHLAREPQDLFLPTTNRQSRPGLVLLAALLARALPSSESFSGWLAQVAGHSLDPFTLELFSTYLPYLALNLAFVWISVGLFGSLTGCRRGQSMAVLLVGCLLIFNDVVKAFLLSPNTALLAIVAPLFALWCYMETRRGRFDRWWSLALLALIAGLGVMTYALFILALPLIWLGLWRRDRDRDAPGSKASSLAKAALVALVTLLPVAAWYASVRLTTGHFFSAEISDYSQVVWLWTGMRADLGNTLLRLADNTLRLTIMAISQAFPALTLGVVAGAVMQRTVPRPGLRRAGLALPLVVSGLCVWFFAIVGLVAERVAYSGVPPIIVAVGLLLDRFTREGTPSQRLALTAAACVVVAAQAVYLIAKIGPFS